MKILVYDKATDFLQEDLYVSIVMHLILAFVLWVQHFYLIKILYNSK